MQWLAIFSTTLGATLIGLAPILVRLSEVSPAITGFYRMIIAFAILLIIGLLSKRVSIKNKKDLLLLSLPGFLFGGDLAFWHWSIKFTSIAHASLFVNTAPIFVCILAYLFFREKASRMLVIALIICIIGIIILIPTEQHYLKTSYLGDAFALIAAVFYAGYLLAASKLTHKADTFTLLLLSSFFAAIPLLILGILQGGQLLPITTLGWVNLFTQAIVVQILGQGLVIFGLFKIKPLFSSLILLWQPVTATVIAAFIFDEKLSFWQIIGALILLFGIYLAGINAKETLKRSS